MRAVDTNVLVRVLVDDPDERAEVEAARALLLSERTVLVQEVVLAELTWVMRTSYSFSRAEVARGLSTVIGHPRYTLERPALAVAALAMFEKSGVDFADCLILAGAGERNCELLTFDKRLARLDGAISVAAAME